MSVHLDHRRRMHACPCGCGVEIPHSKFSCRASWQRLPKPIRQAITDNHGRDAAAHQAAMAEARRWLQANLPGRCEFRAPRADGRGETRCTAETADGTHHCREHWWAET
ncbi:hypothetical protein [Amycolatopsis thermoflava]|uniref:hypothetical protein n=1 Tax=Amycolatopsis thermoflava TaxID=84480 RepID=UPI003821ABD3